eukprot:TRINITY_DN40298_c0_g1_i1.p1 TRINITY_DN40298_c0_g1~~TRINITY_DN40298_c0_g1_i1.p1  ORF type:complete len:240 (-),score=31.56 TRINITY_DN40298_c0_g1_i1:292-948(-)
MASLEEDINFDEDLETSATGSASAGASSTLPTAIGAGSGPSSARPDSASSAAQAEIAALMSSAQPYVDHYAAILRPWKGFFKLRRPDSSQEIQQRIKENLVHFQANYMVVVTLFLGLILLSHPLRFATVLTILGAWALCSRMGGFDPSWQPKVGDIELTPMHRLALLTSMSFMILFLVAGTLLLNLAGLSAVLTACHAGLHPGPIAVGDYSTIPEDEI